MKIRNVTFSQMQEALRAANKNYANNLDFNRFDPRPRVINFTLRVKSSKGPGHRVSFMGKRLPSACWHAHRDFMRALFDIASDAVLTSCHATYKGKTGFEQNFESTGEKNIGSMMQPLYFRHACDC